MDDEDLYCVACGASLLGLVVQICPKRRFRHDPRTRHWHELEPGTGYYFVCAHCGERLDEDAQEHLFEFIVPAERLWEPGWSWVGGDRAVEPP